MSERTAENTCANCAFMDDGQPCEYHLGYQAGLARTAEKDRPVYPKASAYESASTRAANERADRWKKRAEEAGAQVKAAHDLLDAWERQHAHLGVDRVHQGPALSAWRRIFPPAQTSDAKETR